MIMMVLSPGLLGLGMILAMRCDEGDRLRPTFISSQASLQAPVDPCLPLLAPRLSL